MARLAVRLCLCWAVAGSGVALARGDIADVTAAGLRNLPPYWVLLPGGASRDGVTPPVLVPRVPATD